jgi:hypothetical protein
MLYTHFGEMKENLVRIACKAVNIHTKYVSNIKEHSGKSKQYLHHEGEN